MNMRKRAPLALVTLAALGPGGTALADQHGNDYVHSREFRGQVYVMYQTHMSLYTYDKDPLGESTCYGECTETWIPATLENGVELGKSYTLIKRRDGSYQAAFRGKPLYLYSGDKKIGDINGDGIGGVWRLARP